MDAAGLDGFARRRAGRSGHRGLVAGVVGVLAAALVGDATAGKHREKASLCLNGQIIKATGNSVCHAGACSACTVTCTGSAISRALRLGQALETGGNIVVCPRRYAGTFLIKQAATTLVGVGPEDDPASTTILDSPGIGCVVTVDKDPATLSGLRITGGQASIAAGTFVGAGNGVAAWGGDITITNFSMVDNRAQVDDGILGTKGMRQAHGTIERNAATEVGGGIFVSSGAPASIDDVYIATHDAPQGGGVFYAGDKLTMLGCEISKNHVLHQGGAIYL